MQSPNKIEAPENLEAFAGQRILSEDPRTEKTARACVACGAGEARKLGNKNELDIVCCRKCQTLYTPYSPWYTSQYFYEGYYLKADEVEPPAFVKTRLEEIAAAAHAAGADARLGVQRGDRGAVAGRVGDRHRLVGRAPPGAARARDRSHPGSA